MLAIPCQLSGKTRYAAVVWLSGSVYVFLTAAAISDRSRSASDRVRPLSVVRESFSNFRSKRDKTRSSILLLPSTHPFERTTVAEFDRALDAIRHP